MINTNSFPGDSADKNASKSFKTFVFALTFNIRFMHALLEILLPELEDLAVGEDIPNSSSHKPQEKISVTCRRVLPALRQYSVWILTRYTHLLNYAVGTSENRLHIINMWKSHAAVLTKLLDYFQGFELKASTYLLEEDETTIGFKPFNSPSIPLDCRMHTDAEEVPKPHITDPGVKRNHPNMEMQCRVHDMLIIGWKLQENESYPLHFNQSDGTFVSDESIISTALLPSPRYSTNSSQLASPLPVLQSTPEPIHLAVQPAPVRSNSDHSHDSWETEMQSMVRSLVDGKVNERSRQKHTSSNESSYGMHSETVQEVFGQLGSHCTHTHVQTTPKHLPSLPGFNGAFAPKPNEISRFSPTQSSYATAEAREASARELERITGYTNHPSWQRPSGPIAPARPQPLMPFSPLPSTGFFSSSTPSKIGATTPSWLRNNNSTIYPGATDFEIPSSPWVNGKPGYGTAYSQTPPAAQRSQGD